MNLIEAGTATAVRPRHSRGNCRTHTRERTLGERGHRHARHVSPRAVLCCMLRCVCVYPLMRLIGTMSMAVYVHVANFATDRVECVCERNAR